VTGEVGEARRINVGEGPRRGIFGEEEKGFGGNPFNLTECAAPDTS